MKRYKLAQSRREGRVVSKLGNEIRNTQVLIFAGGLARRMGSDRPKALLEVGGTLLIDRCVGLFSACGYEEFVFLLGYGSKAVQDHIGKGERFGISARISVDKEVGQGRANALRQALRSGVVDRSKRSVVTFPDDIFVDESLPLRILLEHMHGVEALHATASLAMTRGRRWPYGTGVVDDSGLISDFQEKPFIKKATSVGLYIFEPPVYQTIGKLSEAGARWGIEQTLIPKLADEGKLYAVFVPVEAWLPVNTQKDLEEAEKTLFDSRRFANR
ncbi:MAG: NTP transferase domain-containing protein [Nitrososphaerota archaeon]|nr:NTP transferase domain-containing protein [Nitrososphaerota archaeon]